MWVWRLPVASRRRPEATLLQGDGPVPEHGEGDGLGGLDVRHDAGGGHPVAIARDDDVADAQPGLLARRVGVLRAARCGQHGVARGDAW